MAVRYVFALLLCTGLDATARDVYLRCRGSLTLHTADLPLVKENQEIAIHVQAKTMIYVSGSQFIVNTSAPICPNRSPSPEELRFDSRSCTERAPGRPAVAERGPPSPPAAGRRSSGLVLPDGADPARDDRITTFTDLVVLRLAGDFGCLLGAFVQWFG